ncbi:unnamed protein product, partial [Cuscuta epithymum]
MVGTRKKMEGRMTEIERNMDRNQQETNAKFEELIARMQAGFAEIKEQKLDRSRSRSHQSTTSHHTAQRHRHTKTSDTSEGSDHNSDHSVSQTHRDQHRYHKRQQPAGRKIDLPVFNGKDVFGWLVRMNRYFRLNQIQEDEKIDVAVVAMEDQALNWFQWWEGHAPRQNWKTFTKAMTKRFQPDMVQDPLGPLFSLKQKGTTLEYRDQFETAMALQGHLTEEVLRSIFLKGLRRDIRAELKLYSAKSLAKVMNLATLIENKNVETMIVRNKDEGRKKTQYKSQNWGDVKNWKVNQVNAYSTIKGMEDSKVNKEVKDQHISKNGSRLSQEELLDRSKRGLCFKCGDNWGKGHVCKMKNYKMMLVKNSEGEEESDMEDESSEGGQSESSNQKDSKIMQLCILSKEGIPSMQTFKVKGRAEWQGREMLVNVLIDSGATHNFLSQELVDKWAIPYHPIHGYKVQIGNGECIPNMGRCDELRLKIQGIPIQQTYYLLGLGGTDIVLGMEWLTELGDMEVNFRNQIIKWQQEGRNCIIKGDTVSNNMEVSMKTMMNIVQQTGEGYLMVMEENMSNMEHQRDMEETWRKVIAEFPEVFTSVLPFPPARACDHAIRIKEGAQIPNLRPYRYSFDQKNEIEKIIEEMLKSGIIKHSNSPYSSPILLAKKKDGGWRFCGDYRALNKVTIPDKFPIPVIEELLDELGEAR